MANLGPNTLTIKAGDQKYARSELIDNRQLGDANFGPDGGTAAETVIIDLATPGHDWKTALFNLREILGWHIAGAGGIIRNPPKRHPFYSNLWATRITGIKGIGYRGQLQTGWGVTSNWQYLEVTIQYSSLQYDIYTDQDGVITRGGEWNRWTVWRDRPRLEYLQSNRNEYRFWPTLPPGLSPNDNVIKQSVPRPKISGLVEVEWLLVPRAYVFGGSRRAVNILACEGKTNNAPFPPDTQIYPAGTLLLEEPHVEPAPAPLPPNTLLGAAAGFLDGYVNIKLQFRFQDPPNAFDQAGNLVATGNDPGARGHNLFPTPYSPLWFRIGSAPVGGVNADVPLFQSCDFTKIFRPVR